MVVRNSQHYPRMQLFAKKYLFGTIRETIFQGWGASLCTEE